MKRSREQATYKFLPKMWVSMPDTEKDPLFQNSSFSMQVENWVYKKLENVYTPKIYEQIKRQIDYFQKNGGNIEPFYTLNENTVEFVEPICQEGTPDILGVIDPLVFYCSKCGIVRTYSDYKYIRDLKCPHCMTLSMRQLQMGYSCTCGFARGIYLPKPNRIYRYKDTPETRYAFIYDEGNIKNRKDEMICICPECSAKLFPKNIIDNIHYKPFSIKSVNLINENEGVLLKDDNKKKIVLARYLGYIDEIQYANVLKNVNSVFDEKNFNVTDEELQEFIKMGLPREIAIKMIMKIKNSASGGINIHDIINLVDRGLNIGDHELLSSLVAQIMEYNTIKYSSNIISLEHAKNKSLEVGNIRNENELDILNAKLGIIGSQLSSNINIVNTAYAFTRRLTDPKVLTDSSKGKLKLNSYFRNGKYYTYNSVLETEGILIELEQKKIIRWLIKNNVIKEYNSPDIEDDECLKKWFLENVKTNIIVPFSSIDKNIEPITYYVYGLLHSMSHNFIMSAGDICGLEKNSLSEIIFPSTTSIFVYSQTPQGVTLGALSGMYEENYKRFINKAYQGKQICLFDPICSTQDNAACPACMYLSEAVCTHFNEDLSRHFLYGGITKDNEKIYGYWEE